MECILLLSRSVRVAGSGWAAGVEDRIPGAQRALALEPRTRVCKTQVLSQGVSSLAWCLAGGGGRGGFLVRTALLCGFAQAQAGFSLTLTIH